MSLWLLALLGAAAAAGLLLLHGFARVKRESEAMLDKYIEILAESRRLQEEEAEAAAAAAGALEEEMALAVEESQAA